MRNFSNYLKNTFGQHIVQKPKSFEKQNKVTNKKGILIIFKFIFNLIVYFLEFYLILNFFTY